MHKPELHVFIHLSGHCRYIMQSKFTVYANYIFVSATNYSCQALYHLVLHGGGGKESPSKPGKKLFMIAS